MSYDLAVWFETRTLSDDEVLAVYDVMIDADPDPRPAHPAVSAFLDDLTARYPVGDLDDPWSAEPCAVVDGVLLSVMYSRADEFRSVVTELARQHGLLCFDASSDVVRTFARTGAFTLWSAEGFRCADPSHEQLLAAVGRMSETNNYIVLERGAENSEVYIQSLVSDGALTLEHREGSADRHYATRAADRVELAGAFAAFLAGDEEWKTRFTWERVDLS
ncbi:hypothetical protein [Winogradskya humida]|uniref:Uncharacterized protein n=1 Tax=Winogradskya humida TaxID=113566 RepID=A0ABQ3ZJ08_9ACTN|nr:hypothetical protein [Actinoplanes humidus]GIE18575.1 hypothetical protein Ahu01nite_016770 [Actinoplanes humidus]